MIQITIKLAINGFVVENLMSDNTILAKNMEELIEIIENTFECEKKEK